MQADDRTKRRTVLAVWLALTVALAGFVLVFGSDVPFWDDLLYVPMVTGAREVDLRWLWRPYWDHRYPLPRAALLVMLEASEYELRLPMLVSALLLAAVALGS